jgi:hypothetical protein
MGQRKKVESIIIGIVHSIAYCQGCDWQHDCFTDKNGRKAIRKHVAKTGHTVQLEQGFHESYHLAEPEAKEKSSP